MSKRPSFKSACAQYPHRYTVEHVPDWAKKPAPSGKFYAPQYRSDREWYENTNFPTHHWETHCHSSGQTWPLGHWLDQPYQNAGAA